MSSQPCQALTAMIAGLLPVTAPNWTCASADCWPPSCPEGTRVGLTDKGLVTAGLEVHLFSNSSRNVVVRENVLALVERVEHIGGTEVLTEQCRSAPAMLHTYAGRDYQSAPSHTTTPLRLWCPKLTWQSAAVADLYWCMAVSVVLLHQHASGQRLPCFLLSC